MFNTERVTEQSKNDIKDFLKEAAKDRYFECFQRL